MKLPSLSTAAKLYTIFALLATATIALAGIALVNAEHHAAMTSDYETSLSGTQNVERVNGLIYAVVMESRGVTCRRYSDRQEVWRGPAEVQRAHRAGGAGMAQERTRR